MKLKSIFQVAAIMAIALPLLGIRTSAEEEPVAEIIAVHLEGTNVVVEAQASGGFTRVTLESSTRVGRRSWEPRAVHHLAGQTETDQTFTFAVPASPAMEILRVRGDTVSAIPATFFDGTNKFASTGNTGGITDGTTGGNMEGSPGAGAPTDADRDSSRTVVESDIWKLMGDTLFFFNQYRGLQIIDVSRPDLPVVRGTYDLAAAGEQMYVMESTAKIILLARDSCSYYGGTSESKVVLLNGATGSGNPFLVKELPVKGYIVESRLVGTALYVVANSYQPRSVTSSGSEGNDWEWGTQIYSFDLSDFENATEKSTAWVPGYNNVISATDRFLFVASYQYINGNGSWNYDSTIQIYDISNPDGTFERVSEVKPAGVVQDKFKMHLEGDVFAVVSVEQESGVMRTMVETFSFTDPTDPEPLGSLKIIENEQLHATRFDGKLLYAVTFMRIDPLWIIDLSNPAAPEIVGELEIPGWSTFIYPLPGKLLTIGHDTTEGWRTSVQLFNVENPSDPTLLSKVLLGDSYSGSEANQEEKAFGVFPEDNLVLIPFHGNIGEDWVNGVQIVDLEERSLVKRGVITHEFGPRRAALHRERILSISARELLTVDATDRDNPQVTHSTELSWATDQVHLVGDFLLEVDAHSSQQPSMRIASAAVPTEAVGHLDLAALPYLGSTVKENRLFVLQGRPREVIWPQEWNPTNYLPILTNPGVLIASTYDLSQLPEVTRVGITTNESPIFENSWNRYEPLWVKEDLIVWATKSSGNILWWYGGGVIDIAAPSAGLEDRAMVAGPWWGGGGNGHFVALDVSGEAAFVSEVKLGGGESSWWNFSDAYTENGLVYTSHLTSEYDPTFDPPPYVYLMYEATGQVTRTNDPPPGAWVQRYYLDVIDFNDAQDPLVRKPVNVPGSLIGVHTTGEMIYTRGYDLSGANRYWQGGEEVIAASGYDGVEARLIDWLPLTNGWPRPSLVFADHVYLGKGPTEKETNSTLQVWSVGSTAAFELVDEVTLQSATHNLVNFGPLLVAQSDTIDLFDATDPAKPTYMGSGNTSTCYGVLLDAGDGTVERGLWVPMGWYGVVHIPVALLEPAPASP